METAEIIALISLSSILVPIALGFVKLIQQKKSTPPKSAPPKSATTKIARPKSTSSKRAELKERLSSIRPLKEMLSEKERGEKRYTSVNYTKPQAPKKKNHSGKCDGDCRNCPPHYGYRHGRWYYGHNHIEGCVFHGNKGGGGRD